MSPVLLIVGLAVLVFLVGFALVLRFGVPGGAAMKALARALNLSARNGRLATALSRAHARIYDKSDGRLLRWWFGCRIMVIETTGRRSGQKRKTTIIYAHEGEKLVVTPANAGVDKTPSWWLNLRDSGRGTAVLGGQRIPVRPRVTSGTERERLWELLVREGGATAEYQALTERRFPVIVLEPLDGDRLFSR